MQGDVLKVVIPKAAPPFSLAGIRMKSGGRSQVEPAFCTWEQISILFGSNVAFPTNVGAVWIFDNRSSWTRLFTQFCANQ